MFDAACSDVAQERDQLLEDIRDAIRRLAVIRAELARDGCRRQCEKVDELVTQLRMSGKGKL